MSCAVQPDSPARFSPVFGAHGECFPAFIEWIRALPKDYPTPEYFSLVVRITQKVTPRLLTLSQMSTLEGPLPAEITQAKNFTHLLNALSQNLVLLSGSDFLKQQLFQAIKISCVQSTVTINEFSRSIAYTCRTNKNKSSMELVCEDAIQNFSSIKMEVKDPCFISGQVFMSESPHCFVWDDSATFSVFEFHQDSRESSTESPRVEGPDLKPQEGVVYEKFASMCGDREDLTETIAFDSVDGKAQANYELKTTPSKFHIPTSESTAPFEIQKDQMITGTTMYEQSSMTDRQSEVYISLLVANLGGGSGRGPLTNQQHQ